MRIMLNFTCFFFFYVEMIVFKINWKPVIEALFIQEKIQIK